MAQKCLENAPKVKRGITWGNPWNEGVLTKKDYLKRNFFQGENLLQSKILAYWPPPLIIVFHFDS